MRSRATVTGLLAVVTWLGAVPLGAAPPASAAAEPIATSIPGTEMSSDYARFGDALLAVQSIADTGTALSLLDVMAQGDGAVASVCHAIAHDLGHAAIAAVDGDASRALTSRNDVCGGGYIHGVVERALDVAPRPQQALLTLCAPDQDGICWHGVGHGAMFVTRMDVIRSLRMCDRAPQAILARRCSEGVFMQQFNAESGGRHGADMPMPSLRGAHDMCVHVRAPYTANCWFYAPNVWLAHYPDDFGGAMGWCMQQPAGDARTTCARGVGSRTVKRHPDQLSVGEGVCASSGDLRDSCLAGMGSYWSVHWGGTREPITVCDGLVVLQDACRRAMRV